jgi:hypothetical protein
MQVGDQRFDGDDIQRLYESNDYPLQRRPSINCERAVGQFDSFWGLLGGDSTAKLQAGTT